MGGTRAAKGRHRDGRTASAITLRPIMEYAATRGVDTAALLAELDVPAAALQDPDFRIPDATHARAWLLSSERARDDTFGLHVAQHIALGTYDVLDYALRYSAALHDAFCRMSKFHRLLCDTLVTAVDVAGERARVRRTVAAHDSQQAECFFAFLVIRARELAGADLPLREVCFSHPPPRDPAPLGAFFGCPVRYRRATEEIVFEKRDFMRKLNIATPGLAGILDRHMRDLLARLPAGDSLMDRVHRAVATTLHEQARPSLKTTARALKASPRTVQRWLGEHGATHREVVDKVRRDQAVRLLQSRELSITEIAFLLGFNDVGGFRRTFKRWTGKTPSSVRPQAS